MPDNVLLCGLSGSGKSTVAPLLAHLRGYDALDTDAIVVAEAERSIAEIFATEGEAGFREREARAVAAACSRSRTVIALGGGALEREDSFATARVAGMLIFLDAPDDVLAARINAGTEIRPLLSDPHALQLMRARRQNRFEEAEATIDTSQHTAAEVAALIDAILNVTDEVLELEGQRPR